jgi:hypothetical protein
MILKKKCLNCFDDFMSYLKNADYVQGQGAGRRKSGVRQSTLADERSF